MTGGQGEVDHLALLEQHIAMLQRRSNKPLPVWGEFPTCLGQSGVIQPPDWRDPITATTATVHAIMD
jgi:hypothetical protein